MTPVVSALYRYPVKSLTPEPRERLAVLAGGKIAGDRVLGFRFADAAEANDEWSSKHHMLALVNTPGVARLRLAFDDKALRLRIGLDGSMLVEDDLSDDGRTRLAAAVAEFALSQEASALRDHPERLPLRLVGDGVTPRYQDARDGAITLHSLASLGAVGEALGDDLDERRFRSNIVIEGVDAWEEQSWVGRNLRIGAIEFNVVRGNIRCLATHANPETGVRDLPVLTTLTRVFGQSEPTFAVCLKAASGGEIRVGDPVEVI